MAAAVTIAATISAVSTPRPYEERLVDLTARRSLPSPIYEAAGGDPQRQAQLLDDLRDYELAFKLRLAVEKYGERGQRVLKAFAGDRVFQEDLRVYGDGIVPVIDFFMVHDFRSLKSIAWAKDIFGGRSDGESQYPRSSPEARGMHAVRVIARDGHRFLAQFSFGAAGTVHWNQTERAMQVLTEFLAGGLRDLETKRDLGEDIGTLDVLSAGADVLAPIAAAKALKFFKAARTARISAADRAVDASAKVLQAGSPAAVGASLTARTQVLGKLLLQSGPVGRTAIKSGLTAATVYLVVRHPSLLNSFFEKAGQVFGLPEWFSRFIGWTLVSLPLLLLIGPVLTALAVLAPVIRAAVWLGSTLRLRSAAARA